MPKAQLRKGNDHSVTKPKGISKWLSGLKLDKKYSVFSEVVKEVPIDVKNTHEWEKFVKTL